jgi:hypothetical protein
MRQQDSTRGRARIQIEARRDEGNKKGVLVCTDDALWIEVVDELVKQVRGTG